MRIECRGSEIGIEKDQEFKDRQLNPPPLSSPLERKETQTKELT